MNFQGYILIFDEIVSVDMEADSKLDARIDFEAIGELLEKYYKVKKSEELKRYNEEMTKKDFVLPLFEALGWNVYNKSKRNDMISAEEAISKKRVDYGFWLNETPKFYLEAKSLKETEIVFGKGYDKQAINYSWLKSCNWAILTNFETLAVFNAEKPEGEWFFTLKSEDYLTSGKEQLELLSKKGFEENSLDKVATKYGKKIQRRPVDKQLLSDLIHFREILSKDILKSNPDKNLSQDDLDEAVQRIIDRLIFIRHTEDRGIESNELQANFRQWSAQGSGNLIKKIREVYRRYDNSYNSKLFSEHLSDTLKVSNEALGEVIQGLYSPEGTYSYDFFAIESDTLGSIYEQYLGNILKKTPKRAKLEESKTHRKEQGIYYTPSYIVDYIVKNTVGEYIKTHTPEEIKYVKILDPACGSGSFLVRAYKELETYWKENSDFTQLTLESKDFYSKKVEILKNNIFGVDLDSKAVEITQLNLLLEISEKKQRLPILQSNIKVGNSLVDDASVTNNAFNWNEQFPQILSDGGFDIVIGNPPYVRQEAQEEWFKNYAKKRFQVYAPTADMYIYFIEKSHNILKRNGIFGIICSNKFMRAKYGTPLRLFLASQTTLRKFVDFGELPIFEDAATFPVIVFTLNNPTSSQNFTYASLKRLDFLSLENEVKISGENLDQRAISGESWTLVDSQKMKIISKVRNAGIPLKDYVKDDIYRGILTGLNKAFVLDRSTRDKLIAEDLKSIELIKPFVVGDSIRKYHIRHDDKYLIFIPNGWTNEHCARSEDGWKYLSTNYPAIVNHLTKFESEAKVRYDKGEFWWELRSCDYYSEMEKPKIVFPDIAKESRFSFDNKGMYVGNTAYIIPKEDYYLLAILNSRLIFSYFKRSASVLGDPDKGGRLRWIYQDVAKIPIRTINPSVESEVYTAEKLKELVVRILDLNQELLKLGDVITDSRGKLVADIKGIEYKIDRMVYDLYGLTVEEQEIVDDEFQ